MSQSEFLFEEWVRNGLRGLTRSRKALLPEEFGAHMRAAVREALLAQRALLDAVVARTEPTAAKKTTRIKVE